MYRLFNSIFILIFLFPIESYSVKTVPLSILPVASEPLSGPVNPNQGIISPFANLGR